MRYTNIKKAVFLGRPNRFIAHVLLGGVEKVCHVKTTGRCRELLVPGAAVLLSESDAPGRMTKYDLVAVYKGGRIVNIDSHAPNRVFREWIESGGLFCDSISLRPEQRFGASRFDFKAETGGRTAFVEVKGVTLEKDGVARFPDAPTERGLRHVKELMSCLEEGYDAYLSFVVQMKGVSYLEPNYTAQPAFAEALAEAAHRGVRIVAFDCHVSEDAIIPGNPVEVRTAQAKHL